LRTSSSLLLPWRFSVATAIRALFAAMTDETTRRITLLDAVLAARSWLPERLAMNLLALDKLRPSPHDWTSAETLMETMELGRCGVYEAMSRLRDRGMIEYQSRRNPGGYLITRYGMPPADWKRPGR
jgi:hypothetical protein